MGTELIVPFLSVALSGVGVYTRFHFTQYQASCDQALKVRRAMEDALTRTARLVRHNKPALTLKPELRNILDTLNREVCRLDDMAVRLPLKFLQREQGHVLRHAVCLLEYLDRRGGDNEAEFFLFLHDVAVGSDCRVENILVSLHAGSAGRGCPVAV